MERHLRRRNFLKRAGLGAAGILTWASPSPASSYPANEAIRVGAIGTGGRSLRALMPNLKKISGVRITAVCDIWDKHLESARSLAEPGAFSTKAYADILERKDIDAVLIGSPDHWHVPMTIDACEAGKDVYVEKPLTHKRSEGDAVIEAQNRHGRVVQVGMQQRSMPHIRKARDILRSGIAGEIHRIHLSWNRNSPLSDKRPRYGIDEKSVDWKAFLGNAPKRPFDEFRFRNWRWFWDYGGGILTDLMVHFIDVANWFCELDAPATAVSNGDHFQTPGLWETPDTIQTLLDYPEQKIQVFFEGTFFNARHGARIEFMGREGSLYVDRGRYEVRPEPGRRLAQKDARWVLGSGRLGADFYGEVNGALMHLRNWIECVRSRRKPSAPAEAGVSAVKGAHLGNEACRKNCVARWSA